MRSGLGKLIWIARIARPGAIYGASAAAQTFSDGEIIGFLGKGGWILENGEKDISGGKKEEDSERMPVFAKFMSGK